MIRFRLGQKWQSEQGLEDSFGLEIDGIDLLPEASEESLPVVVPELLDTVTALYSRGEPLAQVSLPEAHLEIVMWRGETEVELTIVDLGRPARVARGPVRVDLVELSSAAIQCARGLMQMVRDRPQLHSAPVQQMMRQLSLLEHRRMAPLISATSIGRAHGPAGGAASGFFRFEVRDTHNLIAAFGKTGRGPLASLLFDGSISFAVDEGDVIWRAKGKPFLVALEICRQAAELSRARELNEPRVGLQLGGVGAPFELDLASGRLSVPSREYPLSGVELERAMFELGLSIAYFLFAQNRNQRKNPYLTALIERCRDGLAQVRAPVAPQESRPARAPGSRVLSQTAVNRAGQLRRLRFSPLWKKRGLGGDEVGRLLLGARGPIFSSSAMACAFSRTGDLLFRRISPQGVSVSNDYWVLAAGTQRMDCFVNSAPGATWIRDYHGPPIGPSLIRREGLLIATSATGHAFALGELTGREIWRIALARARELFCCVQGQRLLIAADSGDLYGLDLRDGQVRYRLRAAQPFSAPPIAWGRKFLARAGRRERFSLLAADAHRGTLLWTREMDLVRAAQPVAQGNRLFVSGERAQDGLLVCLAATGQALWERRLHLGPGPFTLVALRHRVIACSSRGGAVCFDSDGQALWRLGELSAELLRPCPPAFARGVVIIPGEVVRAVDIDSGDVLAELPAGIGLCDLRPDSKLSLYLLDEDGTLQAHRLASHFAVIAGNPAAE